MIHNANRLGRFTSSENVKIMNKGTGGKYFGTLALTYIEDVRLERNLGRSIELETQAKPFSWGKLCEPFVHDLLGTEYRLCSDETVIHPDIDCWAGSPDGEKFNEDGSCDTIIEIKCPITLTSFCRAVDPLRTMDGMDAMNKIREKHTDGEKWYQQIISNAIIKRKKYAELVVFCPTRSMLDDIRLSINNVPSGTEKNYAWIRWADDDELPWLPDPDEDGKPNSKYKSLNVLRFEVPKADKELMVERILRAKKEYLDGK